MAQLLQKITLKNIKDKEDKMPFTNRIIVTDKNHRDLVVGKFASVTHSDAYGEIIETSEGHCVLMIEGERVTVPWKNISKIY
jgi:ABC-type metal ion transport system substrate-binding protein|tara:strand:- start:168 stop:413 length:246 start_codon:yes stop_codon:yes gene_type:complete